MTDALLFLHLLSAAALFAGIVAFSAFVLGVRPEATLVRPFALLWQAGIVGVLVFGIALAIDIDGYQPWDVWVLIAIALWLAAGGTSDKVIAAYRDSGAAPPNVATVHWVHVALALLLLADMIWKPWA